MIEGDWSSGEWQIMEVYEMKKSSTTVDQQVQPASPRFPKIQELSAIYVRRTP